MKDRIIRIVSPSWRHEWVLIIPDNLTMEQAKEIVNKKHETHPEWGATSIANILIADYGFTDLLIYGFTDLRIDKTPIFHTLEHTWSMPKEAKNES